MGKNTLIAHIMEEKKEVGIAKVKTYSDSIKWKKRLWAISEQARKEGFIIDRKGVTHLYIDVNLADKIYYFLTPTELSRYDLVHKPIDQCTKCGGKLSIDAMAQKALTNKGNIISFWGRDNSYVVLLLILAIGLILAVGAVFYMVGENQKTNELLKKYLVPLPTSNTVTAQFIGVLSNVIT